MKKYGVLILGIIFIIILIIGMSISNNEIYSAKEIEAFNKSMKHSILL